MGSNISTSIRNSIRDGIKASGHWYSVQDFEVFTGENFIEHIGPENLDNQTKTLILQYVDRIQRYCDSYAIELNTNNNK